MTEYPSQLENNDSIREWTEPWAHNYNEQIIRTKNLVLSLKNCLKTVC